MKTMYHKTSSLIQHTGSIINLAEFRRRQALTQRDSLARQPQEGDWTAEEPSGFYPVVLTVSPEERRRARQERRAWRLDICASLAVILMTALFALRMLL